MRDAILAEADRWIDTPYQHQASALGAGCDCLGLIRGIWREVVGEEPLPVPPYTADWAEASGEEALLNAARAALTEIPLTQALPGDVLAFRMRPDAPVKHLAILWASDRILHAYWGRAVCRSWLVPYWRRRLHSAYRFPETP